MALLESQATLHCRNKAALYYINMTIGKRIKVARQRLGMGQEALAHSLGITKQAVYEWEAKDKQPQPEKLPKLRETLRVTFAWLLAGEGPPPDKDSVEVRMDDLMVAAFQGPAKSRKTAS